VVENYGCRNCHGAQLEGGPEEEPPLWGEQFVSAWSGRKLDELAEKITTMPANADPGYQVKPAAAPDVVAYLLQANGYPAGAAELPADPKVLKRITIVAP
jgi:S-disulfanyl-L-cysteine oxidoreductase SoxD